MSGQLSADASSSFRQKLLDIQGHPPDEDPGMESQSHSPIGSAPRSPSSFGADVSAHAAVFTGATSFQGQLCELGPAQCGHSPVEQDSDLLCGWGSLRLKALQVFNTPHWVLFFLSMAALLQGMIINGFVGSVVTSIERRFDLSSSQSGLIVSAYDIAACVCLPFASYFGGNGHKPRWLGQGIMIMGLGSLVFALPHFTTPPYQATAPEKSDLCSANSSDFSDNRASDGLSNYFFVFILGQILHGIGATPLFTLGFTFLDDNVKASNAPIYMGIFYTAATFGPAVGSLLGGYFLSFYSEVTLDTEMTPASPLWVGAWWIGFILCGTLSLPVGFAILGYPKKLQGSQGTITTCEPPQDKEGSLTTVSEAQYRHTLKDMLRSVLLLCTNPTFMFLCLAGAPVSGQLSALSAFLIKYIQSQFRLSSSDAAMLFGIMIPISGLGTLFGSYFMKRFKMQIRGMIGFCIVCTVLGLFANFMFFIHCPTVPLAGVNVPYPNQLENPMLEKIDRTSLHQLNSSSVNEQLTSQCNINCTCDKVFRPVCGADHVMYFSPCYAGCTSINLTSSGEVYTGCSCVMGNVSWAHERVAVAGQCKGSCSLIPLFLTLMTISAFLTTFSYLAPITATLRCVPERQKSFALGIQWILVRTLGNIPSPIVFGTLIDKACLLWQNKDQGSCFFYENSQMSFYLLIACVVYKIAAILFFILAFVFYRPPPDPSLVDPQSTDCAAEHMTELPCSTPPEGGAIVKQQSRI
ncbi:hypothetical protein NL108_016059 [Boleophthalmus pectinirostris]|uniref:solute carrier organic anion transporter family member 4A1-like n=1 Tax=Boleophthalmus pectinirostris TaxID=150288 RepID=UPI00242F2463|nr:solute carrier organic anion transporter family member 4A1-like [Boleophthalmus pectinirostris]KAJ0069900.1 hypothetical protein NL108_016059 [Boleophthalmus pectinirostris]